MPNIRRRRTARTTVQAILAILAAIAASVLASVLIGVPAAHAMPSDQREQPVGHSLCHRHSHAWLVKHRVFACLKTAKNTTAPKAKNHKTPSPSPSTSGFQGSPNVITSTGSDDGNKKVKEHGDNGQHNRKPTPSGSPSDGSPSGGSPSPSDSGTAGGSSSGPSAQSGGQQPLAGGDGVPLHVAPMGGLQLQGSGAVAGQSPAVTPGNSPVRAPGKSRPIPASDVAHLLDRGLGSPVLGIDSPILLAGEVGLFAVAVGSMVAIAGHRRRRGH